MDTPYKCTRSGCDRGFATDEERKRHAAEPHQPCPHGCNRSFTIRGLSSHMKLCELNPERTRGRMPCTHPGCTARFADQAALSAHVAEPHEACVCGSEFTTTSLRKHQVRCSHWVSQQATEREGLIDPYLCRGCDEEIVEGEHYLVIGAQFESRMPLDYKPVRELDPTTIEDVVVHGPACLIEWLRREPLMTNVFGEWGYQTRSYLLEDNRAAVDVWVSLQYLIEKLIEGGTAYSFGRTIKEFDGVIRAVTLEENRMLRQLLERTRQLSASSN